VQQWVRRKEIVVSPVRPSEGPPEGLSGRQCYRNPLLGKFVDPRGAQKPRSFLGERGFWQEAKPCYALAASSSDAAAASASA